ncbi:MAG TPA: hypothetical protein ACN46P_08505, partial [Prochlorococcus sp.]
IRSPPFSFCKGSWAASVLTPNSTHRVGTPQPRWFQVLVASNVMGMYLMIYNLLCELNTFA